MKLLQPNLKIWTGATGERFRHVDMNRITRGVNDIASNNGVPTVSFLSMEHKSQVRIDELNKLEQLHKSIATSLGVTISNQQWEVGQLLKYGAFNRWESVQQSLYEARGGTGSRVPWNLDLITHSATIYPNEWSGTGPYTVDMFSRDFTTDTEGIGFGSHVGNAVTRAVEHNAQLTVSVPSDNIVRVTAHGLKPNMDLPIYITREINMAQKLINLNVNSWSGTGPWTQTVNIGASAVAGVLGVHEGMSDEDIGVYARGVISVSAVSGNNVTIRAIGAKPSKTISPMLVYVTSFGG